MEHSLEVQLPFIQCHFEKNIPVVPILVGTGNPVVLQSVARSLQPYFNERNRITSYNVCYTKLLRSSNCFNNRLTSCTDDPLPTAIRFLREPLIRAGFERSSGVIE